MGSGFQPIGNPFVQSDRLDLKVSPSFNLFEGDFTINGKKYLIYRVSANESYASLSSRYGVLETNIRQANPNHKALLRKGNFILIRLT